MTSAAVNTDARLLTYQQAASLLSVSDRTVWGMVQRGELQAVRFAGRTVRIDSRDIDAFIEAGKHATETKR